MSNFPSLLIFFIFSAVSEKTTYHSIISHFFLSLLDCPTSLSLFTSYAVFEKTPYQIIINHFSLSFLDCPTSLSPFLTLLGTHLSDGYLSVTLNHLPLSSLSILSGLSAQSKVSHPPTPKNRSRWQPWSRTVASISVGVSMGLANQYFGTGVF